uniref:Nuclear receptor n=1 Tax=Rhabditophanes sp. KR3021 TaxID=114890 RepID=A0AC35U6W5_9BILA
MNFDYDQQWEYKPDTEYEEVEEPNTSMMSIHPQQINLSGNTNNHPSLHTSLSVQHQIIEQHSNNMKVKNMNMITSKPSRNSNTFRREIIMTSSPSYNIQEKPSPMSNNSSSSSNGNGDAICAVCGDGSAKLHYSVLACYGCKGFFRRTLTGKYRYVCRFGNNCVVDKFQRNSCRYCRFNRCLASGMDPNAVRPDRDLTGRQRVPRIRKARADDELLKPSVVRLQPDDWTRKLPIEARNLLIRLMNTETKLSKDENAMQPMKPIVNSAITKGSSLRDLFKSKPVAGNKKGELKFENYRIARPDELTGIARKSAETCAAWINELSEISDGLEMDDSVNLTKSCFSAFTIFNFAIRTVQSSNFNDVLCLNNMLYVPYMSVKTEYEYDEPAQNNHLSKMLIEKTLKEVVEPMRKIDLRDEEIVSLKAIILLNPNAKGLSERSQGLVTKSRDKVQDMLYQIIQEFHPMITPSSRFGNLLLLLPAIANLATILQNNLLTCHILTGRDASDQLLNELFDECRLYEEHLINSNSAMGGSSMYENPADISLQPMSNYNMNSGLLNNSGMSDLQPKSDGYTQTEESAECASPSLSLTNMSFPSSASYNSSEDDLYPNFDGQLFDTFLNSPFSNPEDQCADLMNLMD